MALDALTRRSRPFTRAVALAASVSMLVVVSFALSAGSASAALLPTCAARPTSSPFAPWGDTHSYFAMPGGSFEAGAPGWSLAGGAGAAGGNESSFVNGKTDSHSLAMPTGARATSPTVCVSMGENTIRLFVRNPGVTNAVLHIQAFVQNPLTGLVLSTGFDIKGTSSTAWSPTSRLLIPNLLGGVLGTQNLTLAFTTSGAKATWNIDDVFVDPFKSR